MNKTTGIDLSPYVISYDWSGSLEQAGRKLSFSIAYTTTDKQWQNVKIDLGDKVEFSYSPDNAPGTEFKLFAGRVFMQDRKSRSTSMEFVAYDNLIYLSKSHMTCKFDHPVRDIITSVCNNLGVTPGDLSCKDLDQKYKEIEDNKAGSEIIADALKSVTATTHKRYHVFMHVDQKTGEQKLDVVAAGNVIEDFVLNDAHNVTSASHSASIEDMCNQVLIVDKDGNDTHASVKNEADIKKYGLLQQVYKVDDKVATQQGAAALLKKVSEHSSLEAVGNIQCISGYSVTVQEEQIKGTFLITSDSHKIQNNVHTMSLTLDYLEPTNAAATATVDGNMNTTNNTGMNNIQAGIEAGYQAWAGKTMDNGTAGCAEAVGKVGSWYSPFLKKECQNGVCYVPTMVKDAGANCIPFDCSKVEAGDVIVYGDDDHVVIAAGPDGSYVGNSSSQNCVVKGGSFYEMGGLYPTKIIKTSHM